MKLTCVMRVLICVGVAIGLLSANAQAEYVRLSLDEKVRLSDLIVVGTATELSEHAPFSTAARKAVVKVDKVLKGTPPEGDITIGYRSGTEIYDVNNKERVRLPENPIEVGKPVIYFLRKAVSGAYAPVNWQYGILPIEDGNVADPRWPSDEVGLIYRHNILVAKEAPKNHPWDFRGMISADSALEHIREAVKISDAQQNIGRMSINGAPTTVLFETGEQGYRVLVRVPKRASCPSFDVTRVSAVLVPKAGESIRGDRACVLETPPVSADPIAAMEQLAMSFKKTADAGEIKAVELMIDGQKRKFCVGDATGCQSDTLAVACRACQSTDTRGYSEIQIGYTDRPCSFRPDPLPEKHPEVKESNISYHCNTCLFEW